MKGNAMTKVNGMKTAAWALALAMTVGTAARADYTAAGYWKFDANNTTTANHNTPASNFMVVDSTGNQNQLYSYESDGAYDYTASSDVPGNSLFAGSNVASVIPDNNASGVLFHEVNFSGNDFNMSGKSFTIEGFFRTSNNATRQDIVFNGQNNFSYLVNVNEGASGQLRFAAGPGPFPQVNLSGGGGYADGQWYGFVATYQENGAGQQDVLTLTTYGADGKRIETGTALTPAGYNVNSTNNNLGIGNVIFNHPFQGNIDEVRISRGIVDDRWLLTNTKVTVDTFENTHDYKANGVAGTVWDGIVNGTGAANAFFTSNGPTTAGDGNLQIDIGAAAGVGFDSDRANAPFLFQNVKAGVSFDAQVVIESTTFGNYSVLGLMVRDAADGLIGGAGNAGEDYLSFNFNNFGGTSTTVRSSDDGAVSNLIGGALERFLRVVREGDQFLFYSRATDLEDWDLFQTVTRGDLTGDVQVGLWYGLFSGGNAGTAQVENFILIQTIPTPAALPAGLALMGVLTARRKRRA